MTAEPLAWAVLLADGRLYGRYDFRWEAQAIADALLATDGVTATVEPLYRSPTLTDAEREAIWTVAEVYAENDGDAECEQIARIMQGLWQRTK